MLKFSKLALLSALLAFAAGAQAADEKPVADKSAALVNGVSIPQSRVDLRVKVASTQGGQPDSPEMRKAIRDDLINLEILSQAAVKAGLDKQTEAAQQIELARQSVLAGAFVQDYVKSHPVSEEVLKQDYEGMKARVGNKEYKVSHVLVASEDEAKAVAKRVKKEKFAKVAKEKSKDPGSKENGGDLGWTDPEVTSSLLLKTVGDATPDAHDLSLDELWRVPIQTANGEVSLRQLIEKVEPDSKPNLQPDWQNYQDVENQCRRLKLAMKDLGFNKFDRNAVLYYFLNKTSPDWKNFNISAQRAMNDEIRPKLLEQYRARDFSGCLASEDYAAMKSMKLVVNTEQDWDALTNSRQKKEGTINPIQSAARQFLTALQNPNKDEAARQLYPLLNTEKGGNGTVMLQNHLSNFGLETLLQLPSVADEGVVINAGQLAGVFSGLNVESYSCARPAQELGQTLPNVGIMLFTTKPGSPREKGGALEFEVVQGKINRLTFQHPSFRDFEQSLAEYPDLGGCRIEAEFLNKLH